MGKPHDRHAPDATLVDDLDRPPGGDSDAWPTLHWEPEGATAVELPSHELPPAPVDALAFSTRYEERALLGEGGMGRVLLCKDQRIGRFVAVKVLKKELSRQPKLRMRFLREARVQGQLGHPSVVPVHDVGMGPDGTYFFTMTTVRGRTLEHVLRALREDDAETARAFGRHKLLTVFQSVCQAVAFAHEHGVIHRDLKPSNVMIGSFGQVQVLDWGLAKILGSDASPPDEVIEELTEDAHTMIGEMLGTPGYMSPEQGRGDLEHLDARTDVYSLGAILFELLTREPLHPRSSLEETLLSTLHGADARPNERVPGANVPPELCAICVKAAATEAEERYASAKEMLAAIEGFLAGDRDMELRRQVADEHARLAAEAAARRAVDPAERERAMREASAALAIVPGHEAAMTTLLSLVVDQPKRVPPEAQEELAAFQQSREAEAKRGMLIAYMTWILFAPVLMWVGPHDYPSGFIGFVPLALAGFMAWLIYRGARATWLPLAMYLAGSLAIATSVTVAGWAIVLPGMAGVHTVTFLMYTQRKYRQLALVVGLSTILVPFLLDALGVIPSSYVFEEGRLAVLPIMIQFRPLELKAYLLLAALGIVLLPSFVLQRYRVALEKTEEEAFMNAWNVRHLLPGEARKAAAMLQKSARREAASHFGALAGGGTSGKKAA